MVNRIFKLKFALVVVGLSVVFVAPLLLAQEAAAEKAKISGDYRLVDVVVLDDDDEHLVGLKKKNFRLLHNGVEQKILSLDEVNYIENGKVTPLKSDASFLGGIKRYRELIKGQPLWHVLMIANVPQNSSRLKKLEKGLCDFIDDNFRECDKAALFVLTTRGIVRATGFTSDKRVLLETVKKLVRNPHLLPREMAYANPYSQATMLDNLVRFAPQLGQVGGRKSLMLFSAGMPDIIGDDYNRASKAYADNPTSAISKQLDQMKYEGEERKRIAEKISSLSLSLAYTNTSLDVIDLASRKAKTRNSSFDTARRSQSAQQLDDFSKEVRPRMEYSDENRLSLLRDLAVAGGGEVFLRSLFSSGRLEDHLEELYNINSHYYVIGYQPSGITSEDEVTNMLEIKVNHEDSDRVIYKKITAPPKK